MMLLQWRPLQIHLFLGLMLKMVHSATEPTLRETPKPRMVLQAPELLRERNSTNSVKFSAPFGSSHGTLKSEESSHYAIIDADFLLNLFANKTDQKNKENSKASATSEARHFTGIGRPKALLPPGQKRRKRVYMSSYNKTRPHVSSNPHVFAREGGSMEFGMKPMGKIFSKEMVEQREGRVVLSSTTTRKPITLAPPVYKPGPAVIKFSPNLEDMKRAGLISDHEYQRMKDDHLLKHASPMEIVKVKEQYSSKRSEEQLEIPNYSHTTTFKPKYLYKNAGLQNFGFPEKDNMALFVETANSPTYAIPSNLHYMMGYLTKDFEFRKYNVSTPNDELRVHEREHHPNLQLPSPSTISSPLPHIQSLSPTASSFIHPTSPPPYARPSSPSPHQHSPPPQHQQSSTRPPFPHDEQYHQSSTRPLFPHDVQHHQSSTRPPFPHDKQHHQSSIRPLFPHDMQRHQSSTRPPFPHDMQRHQSSTRPPFSHDEQHHQSSTRPPFPNDEQHHQSSIRPPFPHDMQRHQSSTRPPFPHDMQHHQSSTRPPFPHDMQHHQPSIRPPFPHNMQHHQSSTRPPFPHDVQHHQSSTRPPFPHDVKNHQISIGPASQDVRQDLFPERPSPPDIHPVHHNLHHPQPPIRPVPHDMHQHQFLPRPPGPHNVHSSSHSIHEPPRTYTLSTVLPEHSSKETTSAMPPPTEFTHPPKYTFSSGKAFMPPTVKFTTHQPLTSTNKHSTPRPEYESIEKPRKHHRPLKDDPPKIYLSYSPIPRLRPLSPSLPSPPSLPRPSHLSSPILSHEPPHEVSPPVHPFTPHPHQIETYVLPPPSYQPSDHFPSRPNHPSTPFPNHDQVNPVPPPSPPIVHHPFSTPFPSPSPPHRPEQAHRPINPPAKHHQTAKFNNPTIKPIHQNSHLPPNPHSLSNSQHSKHERPLNSHSRNQNPKLHSKQSTLEENHVTLKPIHNLPKPVPVFHERAYEAPKPDYATTNPVYKPSRRFHGGPKPIDRSPQPVIFTDSYPVPRRPSSNEIVGRIPGIPGVANKDYPAYISIPRTTFACHGKVIGYYADPEARCQVFHMCDYGNRRSSFLCPNGTLFNQQILTCDHWRNVDCDKASKLYHINKKIYGVQEKKSYPYRWKKHAKTKLTDYNAKTTTTNHPQPQDRLKHGLFDIISTTKTRASTPYLKELRSTPVVSEFTTPAPINDLLFITSTPAPPIIVEHQKPRPPPSKSTLEELVVENGPVIQKMKPHFVNPLKVKPFFP